MAADVDFPSDLRSLEREYELIREIGQGGMAAVYLARHRASGRLVAIKAVRARYLDDPDAIRRFAREARTVAVLDHPNIVRTEAIEQIDDRAVAIIMEHVAGGTVRDRLREFGSLGAEEAESILRDVANALGYAHRHGIVHRDVKPENVFLDPTRRRALLSDFGIARPIDGEAGITMLGASVGTPQYMSPEQIDGEMVDGRSDIYSLGVLGWELLTGRRPWAGENLYGIIYKQKHEDLPRITALRPRVPANLLFAIEGALNKDKERRWPTTDAFLDQLTYNPPPVLSQTYPPGAERVGYEPTVRFRREVVAETEGASVVPDESPSTADEPPATVPAQPPADAPIAETVAAPTRPAIESTSVGTIESAPNADVPFSFVSRRHRALQVAGLLVPLGIAAGAMFVLLSGNSPVAPPKRGSPNVTTSEGSVAPDSDRGVSSAVDSRAAGGLAASPPADRLGRSEIRPSPAPSRPMAAAPAPKVTERRRRTQSTRASAGGSTTAAPSPNHAVRPESARIPAPATPNDASGVAATARPEPPVESKPSPEPVEDPFKIPGGRDARVSGAPTGAVPSPRCRLASTADQQACLSAYIAAGDAPLDHAFTSLVDEMRRVAGTPPGAPDPPTVQRIRVEQRAWMSVRNTECPRSAPAGAGPFWAGVQAECFNEMATARAAELRDAAKRLRKR